MRQLRVALGAFAVAAAGTLGAQTTTTAAPTTPWTPFIGCWSTSSSGTIGPMVCVAPTDSAQRVEFLTVNGDSVFARAIIDASGRVRNSVSGPCRHAESARWSNDASRLFVHAAVKCGKGKVVRSDAILSMSRPDAFVQVERVTSSDSAPARVINFIVQLDTTVFPLEVRQRLGGYRPLSLETAELETPTTLIGADVVEAARELDAEVVRAWLDDRGQYEDMGVAELRRLHVAANDGRQPVPVPGSTRFAMFRYAGAPLDSRGFPRGYLDDGFVRGPTTTSYYFTPAMVGWGVPYLGYSGGFPWAGWP